MGATTSNSIGKTVQMMEQDENQHWQKQGLSHTSNKTPP